MRNPRNRPVTMYLPDDVCQWLDDETARTKKETGFRMSKGELVAKLVREHPTFRRKMARSA